MCKGLQHQSSIRLLWNHSHKYVSMLANSTCASKLSRTLTVAILVRSPQRSYGVR